MIQAYWVATAVLAGLHSAFALAALLNEHVLLMAFNLVLVAWNRLAARKLEQIK